MYLFYEKIMYQTENVYMNIMPVCFQHLKCSVKWWINVRKTMNAWSLIIIQNQINYQTKYFGIKRNPDPILRSGQIPTGCIQNKIIQMKM